MQGSFMNIPINLQNNDISFVDKIIALLNNSKVFAGLSILMLNLSGRFLIKELPKSIEILFDNPYFRKAIVFFIAFVATRDLKISIFLTLGFILIFKYLINEESPSCIISQNIIDKAKQTQIITSNYSNNNLTNIPNNIPENKSILENTSNKDIKVYHIGSEGNTDILDKFPHPQMIR
jgi:hypothetical protein